MITYRIGLASRLSHHFSITLTVPQPAALQQVSLPVWINGSYLVRDFSRHLSALSARQGRQVLALEQLDTSRWQVRCSGRAALVLRYRVYALDASVRAAFLDAQRGFFNPGSLCLRVHGQEAGAHRLQLAGLPANWDVATTLGMAPGGDANPAANTFEAPDYDDLLDHPVELGQFWRGTFEAGGVPHALVVTGALPGFDGDRLLADTRRICLQQIDFWHAHDGSAPPFRQYLFLLNAVADGYGGLEHRSSTALIAARRDLPQDALHGRQGPGLADGHVTLLGLISHEYFHTWNVKRLKPADLAQINLQAENPTRLLWFFEGFTSYYDDLLLLRCGLIDAARYLQLLAKSINAVAATPGRRVQSVAQASFEAWTKYYRPDENTPNATVSYYQKGALVALAFDLTLRQHGASLDAVMRGLWQRSGAGGPGAGRAAGAITEADISAVLASVAGRPLAAELQAWVHGTAELPLADLLSAFGVQQRQQPAPLSTRLGLRLSEGVVSGVQVRSVLAGSVAEAAGVSAGDELLAVDGWRVRRLDEAEAWLARAQPFALLLVRDQRLLTLRLRPAAAAAGTAALQLHLQDKPGRSVAALRRGWLGA